jgi:replication factor C subunit 1
MNKITLLKYNKEMFTIKYRPKNLDEFVGNKNAIKTFTEWLLNWNSTNILKCALVFGVNGIGKSLLTELLLNKYDYNIVVSANDDDRNNEYFKTIKPLLSSKINSYGKKNIIVFSDIDVSNDYNLISNIIECIKVSIIPIICICDDKFEQSIKPILKYCFEIKLYAAQNKDIFDYVKQIILKEKLKIDVTTLKRLIENANGDIRFILNNLQLGILSGSKDNSNSNVFETTKDMFSLCNGFDIKYSTYWLANNIHPLMIHENYINNKLVTNNVLDNISYSANALSDYDMTDSYIHTNANWELEPYSAYSIIQATSGCHNSQVVFTQYLGKISKINANKKAGVNKEEVINVFTKDTSSKEKPKVAKKKVVKEKVVKEKVIKEKVIKEKVVKAKNIKA